MVPVTAGGVLQPLECLDEKPVSYSKLRLYGFCDKQAKRIL